MNNFETIRDVIDTHTNQSMLEQATVALNVIEEENKRLRNLVERMVSMLDSGYIIMSHGELHEDAQFILENNS